MNTRSGSFSSRWTTLVALAAATLLTAGAAAQDKKDLLIPAEAAKLTLNKTEISVAAAERVAKVCVEYAKANNLLLSIFILAPSGGVVYAYRMDGENPIQIDTAWRKAQTVLYMRTSTHAMVKRYGENMRQTMYNLGQFPHSGALPIILDGQLIGAIGVGGAAAGGDEKCAYEALTAVVGPQPPLTVD